MEVGNLIVDLYQDFIDGGLFDMLQDFLQDLLCTTIILEHKLSQYYANPLGIFLIYFSSIELFQTRFLSNAYLLLTTSLNEQHAIQFDPEGGKHLVKDAEFIGWNLHIRIILIDLTEHTQFMFKFPAEFYEILNLGFL